MAHLLGAPVFNGTVDFGDNHHIDAFGRLRVSSPVNLWTSHFEYNLHPLFFDETTVAGGTVTHLPNESAAALAVTTDDGSKAILQTYEYFRYQPGKSHCIAMTFVADPQQANTDMRIGYFDDNNGIFLELTGASTVNLVRRTKTSGSVVDNKVAQADWNLDKLDGSGPSGVTLDLTKGQILWIDMQWLSQGRIRVGFDIDGVLFYVHQFLGANVLDVPTITTADLPIRWEIVNIGEAAEAKTLTAICGSVFSEGGAAFELGNAFTGGNGATLRTGIGSTPIPVFSLRPATTFNGITNRVKVRLTSLDIFATDSMFWQVIYKPTSITGANFSAPVTHSSVEVDVAGTAISGGVVVASGYIAASNKGGLAAALELASKYPFFLDAAGTGQGNSFSIVVVVVGTGTNKSAAGSANWVEIR